MQMRVALQAASIVHQCHDKMARGLGAPNEDDMRSYAEEAAALSDLWEETLPKEPTP
jgi:hypothetical protein